MRAGRQGSPGLPVSTVSGESSPRFRGPAETRNFRSCYPQLWVLAASAAHRVPCQIDGTECEGIGDLTAIGKQLFFNASHPYAFDGSHLFVTEARYAAA